MGRIYDLWNKMYRGKVKMISDLGMYKKSCLHAFHHHHRPTCVHPLLDEVFPMKCNVPRSPTWQVDWGSQDAAVHPLAFTTSTGGDIGVYSRHCTRLFRFNSLPYEFFWYSYVCGKHIVMLGNRWGIKSRVATKKPDDALYEGLDGPP